MLDFFKKKIDTILTYFWSAHFAFFYVTNLLLLFQKFIMNL
jgi:hypothetical protein